MFIHEAVGLALAQKCCIRRKGPLIWSRCKVRPTNDLIDCCYLIAENKAPCPRWQPQAEDLMADDWVLVPND